MKKFDFKFDKVLKAREIQEELAQNELIKARNKARKIENNIDRLTSIQEETYNFLRENENRSVSSLQARRYLKKTSYKIRSARNDLSQQERIVDKKLGEVVEKSQNRKVLESLKEKAADKYYNEHLKKQQKELDELAIRATTKDIRV